MSYVVHEMRHTDQVFFLDPIEYLKSTFNLQINCDSLLSWVILEESCSGN